jgi:hypothetical protein
MLAQRCCSWLRLGLLDERVHGSVEPLFDTPRVVWHSVPWGGMLVHLMNYLVGAFHHLLEDFGHGLEASISFRLGRASRANGSAAKRSPTRSQRQIKFSECRVTPGDFSRDVCY